MHGFEKIWLLLIVYFHITWLSSHILNENKKPYAAFIDLTKVFDHVVRENEI